MAPLTLPLCIFSLLVLTLSTAVAATTNTTSNSTNNFIQSKCNFTSYPTVCVQTLSTFSNKIQKSQRLLTQIALIVSLAKARYAKNFVAQLGHSYGPRPREVGSVKDCLDVIGDTVDRLTMSVHEFRTAVRAHSSDFLWHMSNVQTWASAALTDENTCVDGFEGRAVSPRMRSAIKAQFEGVMQCTSNALALINQFANNTKYYPNNV